MCTLFFLVFQSLRLSLVMLDCFRKLALFAFAALLSFSKCCYLLRSMIYNFLLQLLHYDLLKHMLVLARHCAEYNVMSDTVPVAVSYACCLVYGNYYVIVMASGCCVVVGGSKVVQLL